MNIAVYGLGYVGSVMCGVMASNGHRIWGVDVNERKVTQINHGESPVFEPGLSELISSSVSESKLCASLRTSDAIENTDVGFICVGTPSQSNGDLDLSGVTSVVREIAAVVSSMPQKRYHLLIRSTVKPGTVDRLRSQFLADPSIGSRMTLSVNPEFLREGTAIKDFLEPPHTIVGVENAELKDVVRRIYGFLSTEILFVGIREAEMIKYVNNTFHALKVSFTNEVSAVCKEYGINSRKLFELFRADKQLNVSEAYLRPGFAYGGSCLPKDLRGLENLARMANIAAPLISAIGPSNTAQIARLKTLIESYRNRRIGFWGIAFKDNTDDLRESPIVGVVEHVLGKGGKVKIFDSEVKLSFLQGGNLSFLRTHFEHFEDLLVEDPRSFCDWCEVIVLHKKFIGDPDIIAGKILVDLRGQSELERIGEYIGINW